MRVLAHHLCALGFAFAFAVVSVLWAAAMAPDRDDPMRIAYQVATGGSDTQLCAGGAAAAAHCVFCHALDRPPLARAPDRQVALWLDGGPARAGDLLRVALAVRTGHPARAPPVTG